MIPGKLRKPSLPDQKSTAGRPATPTGGGSGATTRGRSVSLDRKGPPQSASTTASQPSQREPGASVRDRKPMLSSSPADIQHLGKPRAAASAPGAGFDRVLADILQAARQGKSTRDALLAFNEGLAPLLQTGDGRRMPQDKLDWVLRRLAAAWPTLRDAGRRDLFTSMVGRLLRRLGAQDMLASDRDQVLAFATQSPHCRDLGMRTVLTRCLFVRLGGQRMPLRHVEPYFRGLIEMARVDAQTCAREITFAMQGFREDGPRKTSAIKGIDGGMVQLTLAQARALDRGLASVAPVTAAEGAGAAAKVAWESPPAG